MIKNDLKKIRESLLMSKAELARKANISDKTITRIENGMPCRMETKRKILLALGLKISDKNKVFWEMNLMFCDRCGKETNHIYITEKYEKVCERTCNGEADYSSKIFYASRKSFGKLSKSMASVSPSANSFN